MNQKLTKDRLVKIQSDVMNHFSKTEDSKLRSALLKLTEALENVIQTIPADAPKEYQGKMPLETELTDPVHIFRKALQTGECQTANLDSWPSEALQKLISKACS